jgi:hypothetical protein
MKSFVIRAYTPPIPSLPSFPPFFLFFFYIFSLNSISSSQALDMEGTQLKKMAAYRAELDAEREAMLAKVVNGVVDEMNCNRSVDDVLCLACVCR